MLILSKITLCQGCFQTFGGQCIYIYIYSIYIYIYLCIYLFEVSRFGMVSVQQGKQLNIKLAFLLNSGLLSKLLFI